MSGPRVTPPEGGYVDGRFDQLAGEIEELYRELCGLEAVARAFMDAHAAASLERPSRLVPEIGPPGVFEFTMPTRQPYEVTTFLRRLPDADDGIRARIGEVFAEGRRAGSGVADGLRNRVTNLYGALPQAVISPAVEQYEALARLNGRLFDDFAEVQVLIQRHFHGESADAFLTWYLRVDDIVGQLVRFAGVAQVAAIGTGDALDVARTSMVQIMESGVRAMDETARAWRQDALHFPAHPGVGALNVAQFMELVDKISVFVELLPGAGKVIGGVKTAGEVIGAAASLIGGEQPAPVPVQPYASDLLAAVETSLELKSRDFANACDKLAGRSTPHRQEVSSRPELVLSRLPEPGSSGWEYDR